MDDTSFNNLMFNLDGYSIGPDSNPAYDRLLVNNNTFLLGSTQINGILDVSNINVLGSTVLSNGLNVNGDIYANDNIDISKNLTIFGSTFVHNSINIKGETKVRGNIDISGTGDLTISGDVNIGGSTYINKGINISGDLVIDGNIHVKGLNIYEQYNIKKGVKGDHGEIGPRGQNGVQGFKGMQGNTGKKGESGINSCVSSDWVFVNQHLSDRKGVIYLLDINNNPINQLSHVKKIAISNYDVFNRTFTGFYIFLENECRTSILQINNISNQYAGGIIKINYKEKDIHMGLVIFDAELIQKYSDYNNIAVNHNITNLENLTLSFTPLNDNLDLQNRVSTLENEIVNLNNRIQQILSNL